MLRTRVYIAQYIVVFLVGVLLTRFLQQPSDTCADDTKPEQPPRKSFLEVGWSYQVDKITYHRYGALYEKYLSQYVQTNVSLLEIGLGCGMEYGPGMSAHVWRDYLGPHAQIHFLEYDRRCGKSWYRSAGRRVQCIVAHRQTAFSLRLQLNVKMFYGDQGDPSVLEKVIAEQGYFDVIIDDGSHVMKDQITSFIELLPKVRPGGLYVIEDLHTSYMHAYGGGYRRKSTTIEWIKKLVDDVQSASPRKSSSIADRILSFEISDKICFFTLR